MQNPIKTTKKSVRLLIGLRNPLYCNQFVSAFMTLSIRQIAVFLLKKITLVIRTTIPDMYQIYFLCIASDDDKDIKLMKKI